MLALTADNNYVSKKEEYSMQTAILKDDGKKYDGKYVAIRSFKNNEVLCSGKNPTRVFNCAKKLARSPVVFFVPPKGSLNIY